MTTTRKQELAVLAIQQWKQNPELRFRFQSAVDFFDFLLMLHGGEQKAYPLPPASTTIH